MTKVSADHKVISAELQICRKIRRQFARRAINDLVIIRATVANEGDSGELVNHFRRVGRAGIAIRIHQRNMVVLEADGFFRVIHDPAREENSAVEQFVAQVDDQADVGAGRFGPEIL